MEFLDKLYLIIKFLFLGVFQGFTEPIPISSSGHLVIAQHLLGIKLEGLEFEILVNFASLLAVLLIYRKDLLRLTVNGLSYVTTRTRNEETKADFRFIVYLFIATIPVGVLGILFEDFIETNLKGLTTIGITLLITGFALWLIRNLRGRKGDGSLTYRDAIIIGLAQAIALIPGISRSGATIVAAMGLGLKQETALRFSFLLYIPVSIGGIVFAIDDLIATPNIQEMIIPYALAFIGSLIASYYSLRWFMGIMARGNLIYFAVYCFIVGASVLFFS